MKKFICISFLLSFSCMAYSLAAHEEISLETIVSSIREAGIANTLKTIENDGIFEKKSRQIVLSNKVGVLGADRFEKVKWTTSKLSENGKEFALSIPIGGYSFISPFSEPLKFKIFECEDNGASSGIKVISFDNNSLAVIESWSCGSLGCSYDFLFSKNTTETNQHFCL